MHTHLKFKIPSKNHLSKGRLKPWKSSEFICSGGFYTRLEFEIPNKRHPSKGRLKTLREDFQTAFMLFSANVLKTAIRPEACLHSAISVFFKKHNLTH